MSDAGNPYRSPEHSGAVALAGDAAPRLDGWAMAAWPVVFGLNAIVPALFGWNLTSEHGRLGMALATAALLAAGWLVCWQRPAWARLTMMGSIPIAATQLFPLVHIVVGLLALLLVEGVGLGQHSTPQIGSELAGFVATLLVGLMLLGCAAAIGALLSLLPLKWSWFGHKG